MVGYDVFMKTLNQGIHWKINNDAMIFDLTYFATKNLPKSTIAWASMLIKLGYVGIYDPGNSVIHSNEPMQLVCLTPEAYDWVDSFETKAIRKPNDVTPAQRSTRERDTIEKNLYKTTKYLKTVRDEVETWTYDVVGRKWAMKVMKSPDTPPDVLEKLWDKFPLTDKPITTAVMRNANLPIGVLRKVMDMLKDQNLCQRFGMVRNFRVSYVGYLLDHPNCPPEAWQLIDVIAFYPGESGNERILADPSISAEKLQQILDYLLQSKMHAEFKSKKLKQLFKNPNLPPKIMQGIYNEHGIDDDIDASKKDSLEDLYSDANTNLKDLILANPNLPENIYNDVMKRFLDKKADYWDLKALSQSVSLKPADALKVIQNATSFEYKDFVAVNILKNASFSSSDIDVLTKKFTSVAELTSLIHNKNVSYKTLHKLMQHPNRIIASLAKDRLASKKYDDKWLAKMN